MGLSQVQPCLSSSMSWNVRKFESSKVGWNVATFQRSNLRTLLISPGVIVLANVAELHFIWIPLRRVVNDCAALEYLHKHGDICLRIWAAAIGHSRPVWFGNRVTRDVNPIPGLLL